MFGLSGLRDYLLGEREGERLFSLGSYTLSLRTQRECVCVWEWNREQRIMQSGAVCACACGAEEEEGGGGGGGERKGQKKNRAKMITHPA